MSEIFAKPSQRQIHAPNSETISNMLEENANLLVVIGENFNKGRLQETIDLQKQLHRNLVYLTCLAYPNKPVNEIQNFIPSPETSRKQIPPVQPTSTMTNQQPVTTPNQSENSNTQPFQINRQINVQQGHQTQPYQGVPFQYQQPQQIVMSQPQQMIINQPQQMVINQPHVQISSQNIQQISANQHAVNNFNSAQINSQTFSSN